MNKKWLVIALFVAAGCRQGIGERCQVNDDCASGACSTSAPQICVNSEDDLGQIEASVPCDAPCFTDPAATGQR